MRLHADGEQELDPALIATGQDVLRRYQFTGNNGREDYRLGEIARACLGGEEGGIVARELCTRLEDRSSRAASVSQLQPDR